MAQRGLCSRREADEFISRGLVFVDGVKIDQLGTKVFPHQVVTLAPAAQEHQQGLVTILLNKPIGYVSGQPEKGYHPAVELITPENRAVDFAGPEFRQDHLRGLAPAGRLDIDSKGLLVFTQDGRLARQLTGEHSEIDKEYLVRVEGELGEAGLSLLRHGLTLDDRPLLPAQVEWINSQQLRFVLHEGRKRQIRRMCELLGLKVTGLKRVRIGKIPLGKIPEGQWRYLLPGEAF
ncbi:MAG: rRNA pseudouridine synthase [Planctomycetes bacterium]|nr:rRNA pseudouridine synthase [Planctomycetota bacterium]